MNIYFLRISVYNNVYQNNTSVSSAGIAPNESLIMNHITLQTHPTEKPQIHNSHNGHNGVSIHQPQPLLNRLFRHRLKKTSKLRVTGLCAANSPLTSEFPAQMASNAENVSIWWRHHVQSKIYLFYEYRLASKVFIQRYTTQINKSYNLTF